MNFEFATSTRIVFGAGKLSEAGKLAALFGTKAFLVTGRDPGRAECLQTLLQESHIEFGIFPVPSEPEVALVTEGAALARTMGAEVVIAFGGGSALDAGKAIAALAVNPGEILQYLEVVGEGKPLPNNSLPFIAIPTTSGTGTEVTRNAVLSVPAQKVKVSLRDASMLPRVAIVDPEVTLGLPAHLTATTGLDALTQLIEPFVSTRANPLTDAICREGMRLCAGSLRAACANGHDRAAREAMSLASLFGGMALANSGLGAVHGFAAAIGGMFPVAHGAICAALLPAVWRMNITAARRGRNQKVLDRFQETTRILAGDFASIQQGTDWLDQLVVDLRIPKIASHGISRADFQEICKKAARASSMKANPVELSQAELKQILEEAF